MALLHEVEFSQVPVGPYNFDLYAPKNWTEHSNPAVLDNTMIVQDDIFGRALRIQVIGSGDTTTYRQEFNGGNGIAGPTKNIPENAETWTGLTVKLASIGDDGPLGRFSVAQWHQDNPSSLSPPAALTVHNDQWIFQINHTYVNNPTVNSALMGTRAYLGPAIVGALEEFVFRYAWKKAGNGAGTIQIWRNGTLVFERTDLPTAYALTGTGYVKFGIYSYGWTGGSGGPLGAKQAADFYSYRLGESYADVARAPKAGYSLT